MSPLMPGARQLKGGDAMGSKKYATAYYSFATDGGAVGDITLRGDSLPSGAIITEALLHVDTILTSGGAATVAIKSEGAADIQAAAAISGAPWSTAGAKRASLVATSAPVKTTAARNIVATVAVAALTAGKFSVVVEYVELVAGP